MSNDSSSLNKTTPSPQKPANVPWNAWLGLTSAISIFFVAQLFASIPAGILYELGGGSAVATDTLSSNISYQFLFILVIETLIVGALVLFLKFYKTRLASIGLRRPKWSDLVHGLAAVPFYFVLYLITVSTVTALVPGLDVNQPQEIGFNNPKGVLQLGMTFVSLVVLPPLAEEILFRGFIYSSLKKGLPIAGAVIVTSGLFAIAHLPAGGAAGPLYIAAIDTFVLSLVLIYLREKTGGLWSSMTLHAIKNGVAFMALFVMHI